MAEEFVGNLNKKPLEEKINNAVVVLENIINLITQNENIRNQIIKQIQHKIIQIEGKIRYLEQKIENGKSPLPPPPPPLVQPRNQITPEQSRSIMMRELDELFNKKKKTDNMVKK